VHRAARLGEPVTRRPRLRRLVARAAPLLAAGADGPDEEQRARSGSLVIAVAGDVEVRLEGIDGYDFTARILAWAAQRLAREGEGGARAGEGGARAGEGGARGGPSPGPSPGPLGPVEAFGLDALIEGCRESGLARA
jgi:hypothetical protein